MSTIAHSGSQTDMLQEGEELKDVGAPTLEDAKMHEVHHHGGDVSAEYHELEGATKEVVDASKEGEVNTEGPIFIIVMVCLFPFACNGYHLYLYLFHSGRLRLR